MKLRALVLASGVTALVHFSVADAEAIKYVFDGTASGTLGSQTFSNVELSATAVTDTSDVPAYGEEILFPAMPFTINIAGIGSTSVSTGLLGLYNFPSEQFVAWGWVAPVNDQIAVIEIDNSVFATYDMKTSVGPITETGSDPFIGNWLNMSTSGGNLSVNSWDNVSFTATLGSGSGGTSAVPLPNSAAIALVGLAGLGSIGLLRRMRRAVM
ncbi:MAG: hypothetical protein ABSD28_01110 [Tepidisphaeraceae bacterium]|jgi:hypothetical protein